MVPHRQLSLQLLALMSLAAGSTVAAADPSAAPTALQLMPADSIAYAEVGDPAGFVEFLLAHPTRQKLESMEAYQQAQDNEQYRQFLATVAIVQSQLGATWQQALEQLIGGGLHLAFSPQHKAFCLVAEVKNADFATKTVKQLLDWAAYANKQPLGTRTYQGVEIYDNGKQGAFSMWQNWIIVSNRVEGVQAVIDQARQGGPSLADRKELQSLAKDRPSRRAWAFVDLEKLRMSGLARQLFRGQADNPAAELLFGGILANLQRTGFATAELLAQDNHARLVLQTPHQPEWIEGPREHFFGPDGEGQAVEHVRLPDGLLSVVAYRDIARMWLQADDLFTAEMVDSLTEADSNLTTLFGGRDFGEDILGSLQPQVQFVVAPQQFTAPPKPAIQLPGFALIARLKDPERMRPDLRRTYQSLVGFLNIVGAMEGNPQLDLSQAAVGRGVMHTATYVPEPEEKSSETARIYFNFSPSIAFQEDLVVFSSSIDLAKLILQGVGEPGQPAATTAAANTLARATAAPIRKMLEANKNQLIAQNILSDGHTREEAEAEIGGLLQIVSLFQEAAIRLQADDRLTLQIDATLAP